ncbi:MAG: hypothetical protein PHQ75_00105 [Thermoguttaceae bacterium]|nr:hypothetical protein [Thermoguttaceae bacterium]
MGSQLVCTLKYGVLAAIAFVGPQLITNSGTFLSNVERKIELEDHTPVLTPAESNSASTAKTLRPDWSASPQGQRTSRQRPIDFASDNKSSDNSNRSVLSLQKETAQTTFSESGYPTSPVTPLEEIVRFDRYPAWIVERWPRVETVQAELPLFGYRVAVLTGDQVDDLTGVLTYYYDNTQMQKISFRGQTGDYRKIVRFLQYRFGMNIDKDSSSREMTWRTAIEIPGSSHHVSLLVVKPVQSFDSRRKGDFFDVTFELNRP